MVLQTIIWSLYWSVGTRRIVHRNMFSYLNSLSLGTNALTVVSGGGFQYGHKLSRKKQNPATYFQLSVKFNDVASHLGLMDLDYWQSLYLEQSKKGASSYERPPGYKASYGSFFNLKLYSLKIISIILQSN